MRRLIATEGPLHEPTADGIAACLEKGTQGFWLDVESPDADDYQLLRETFKFHPLTLEDIRHQNQRPKLEEYEGYNFVVLFAAEWVESELAIREHHLYLSNRYLVSVHIEPSDPLDRLRARIEATPELRRRSLPFLFYLVVDQIVDALFPVLERLDDETDALEDAILDRPTPQTLAGITRLKHAVVDLRRVLGAQRDVFQRLTTHAVGTGGDAMTVYYRDVYDHIVRQYETADSLRDLLTGAMDVYLSTVSNRLNDVMRRLTVIATLFMPLSFITGFFGMNFGWLIGRIGGPRSFALGLGVMAATALTQLLYFRRRGWA